MNIETPVVVTCRVVGVNHRERAHVQGAGGGGLTYGGTGFTVPVSIQTVHERLLEVWVAFSDGREDRLDFGGIDLPVWEGHDLALLMSGRSIWAVRNLSTGMTNTFISVEQLTGPRPVFNRYALILVIVVFLFVASVAGTALWSLFGLSETGLARNWEDISAGIAVIAGSLIFLRYHGRRKKVWTHRSIEATALVSEALKNLGHTSLQS